MKSGHTSKSKAEKEADGEGEFQDAKDNWEEAAGTRTNNRSLVRPSAEEIKVARTTKLVSEQLRPAKGFWSGELSSHPVTAASFKKHDQDKSTLMKKSVVTPYGSRACPTVPTNSTSGKVSSTLNFGHNSCPTAIPPHIHGILPPQPLQRKQSEAAPPTKPRNRVPPIAVVKTQKALKDSFEFNNLKLQQELRAGTQPIWVARFSADGAFFATAGVDHVVRVWEVGDYAQQSAELLFNPKPFREYAKHTSDVLDLSWCSKNTCLLLSAGLDSRIMLWNLNTPNVPIEVFDIAKQATTVCFVPDSDEYFMSGSFDMIVRLWKIPTKTIVDWQKTADIITSMQFSPDGRKLLVGLFKGQCFIFSLDSLKLNYISVINCRNRYGTYSGGRKVTGIHFMSNSEALVTTADSRLRIINLDDFSQKYKYKGHKNLEIPMCASLSEDEDYVICGSEDGNLYIWNRICQYVPAVNPLFTGFNKDHNQSYEFFSPFGGAVVTSARFVPLDVLRKVSKCLSSYVPPALVKQIIVACSHDGQIKVFYQITELK